MAAKKRLTSRGRVAVAVTAAVVLTVGGLVASWLNASRPPVGGA